jgi:hypothetical protein
MLQNNPKISRSLHKANPFKKKNWFLLGTNQFHTSSVLSSNTKNSDIGKNNSTAVTQDTVETSYSNVTSEAQNQLRDRSLNLSQQESLLRNSPVTQDTVESSYSNLTPNAQNQLRDRSLYHSQQEAQLRDTSVTQDTVELPYSNLNADAQNQLRDRYLQHRQQEAHNRLQNGDSTLIENPGVENIINPNITESETSSIAGALSWIRNWFSGFSYSTYPLNPNEEVGLFHSISIVSSYISRLNHVNPNLFPNQTLTGVFNLFINNETVQVSRLMNHLDVLFRDRAIFTERLVSSHNSIFFQTRIIYSSFFRFANSSPSTSVNSTASTSVNIRATLGVDAAAIPRVNPSRVSISRPLGSFGDITLNELITLIYNLEWTLPTGDIIVNPLPLLGATIGYGLVMRVYVRTIHNLPYPTATHNWQFMNEYLFRRRQLMLFAIGGAPIAVILLRLVTIRFRDVIRIELPIPSPEGNTPPSPNGNTPPFPDGNPPNSNGTGSSLVLFFSTLSRKNFNKPNSLGIKNKLPNWFKIIVILFIIISLKMWGLKILLFLFTKKFWTIYFAVILSLIFLDLFSELILLHLFRTRKISLKKLNFLPKFLQP